MGSKPKALLATSLFVLLLSGCGDDSQGTSPANSARASQPPAATESGQSSKSQGDRTAPEAEAPRAKGSSARLPSPQPGSKRAAPGVPTSKEGDNSIQVYGVEASDAERTRIAALIQSYLDARATGNWVKACSLLAAKPRAEHLQLAPGAKSCAEAAAFFAEDANPATLRKEAQIEVLSLRTDPRFAFLIYRRSDGIWATALEREEGQWKVISVTPAPVG